MNWEAIGAVGEVFGAVGVIVTLGYLAVQIRRNTTAMRAAASNDALSVLQELVNENERYHAIPLAPEASRSDLGRG